MNVNLTICNVTLKLLQGYKVKLVAKRLYIVMDKLLRLTCAPIVKYCINLRLTSFYRMLMVNIATK